MMNGDQIWQRDDGWAGSEIEDSFVMINIETGQYVALNPTASAVWDAIAAPCRESDIVSTLQQRFDVDEGECGEAVSGLLTQMQGLSMAMRL